MRARHDASDSSEGGPRGLPAETLAFSREAQVRGFQGHRTLGHNGVLFLAKPSCARPSVAPHKA